MENNFKKRFYITETLMIIGILFLLFGAFLSLSRRYSLPILLLIAGVILYFTGGFLEYTKIKWY